MNKYNSYEIYTQIYWKRVALSIWVIGLGTGGSFWFWVLWVLKIWSQLYIWFFLAWVWVSFLGSRLVRTHNLNISKIPIIFRNVSGPDQSKKIRSTQKPENTQTRKHPNPNKHPKIQTNTQKYSNSQKTNFTWNQIRWTKKLSKFLKYILKILKIYPKL